MHVDLIGPYSKFIRQQQPDGAITNNNVDIACMSIINPTAGWFEILEVPRYDLSEAMGSDDE